MLRPYSCQLLVGVKHLEDKLSVIPKNSSPNASPVQLLVGAKHLEDKLSVIAKNSSDKLPITHYLLPITYYLFSTLSDAIAYQICRKVF
jgi:hypothetical protein